MASMDDTAQSSATLSWLEKPKPCSDLFPLTVNLVRSVPIASGRIPEVSSSRGYAAKAKPRSASDFERPIARCSREGSSLTKFAIATVVLLTPRVNPDTSRRLSLAAPILVWYSCSTVQDCAARRVEHQ